MTHPESRATVCRTVARAVETGEQTDGTFSITQSDGHQRAVDVTYMPATGNKDEPVLRGSLSNVTEQKQREQELQRQNKRLGEFTSIVSHDLRNPLQVVSSRIKLVQTNCESEHLRAAADAVNRAQALIEETLQLAREGNRIGEIGSVTLTEVATSSWQSVETDQAVLKTD
jgi:Bacteriophytochrome (light-regulated signal transduction histidine kinase)